jgi:hypothetical protein
MKRLLACIMLACALMACVPNLIGPDPRLELVRTGPGAYQVTAKVGPRLNINSSSLISAWSPESACAVADKVKGEVTALKCAVTSTPFVIRFVTSSETPNVQIVDGFKPITGFVTISP